MEKKRILWIVVAAAILFTAAALIHCHVLKGRIDPTAPLHKPVNSVYYWKTSYYADEAQLEFMRKNNVRRMYVRMFDVVQGTEQPEPNATITLHSSLPDSMEIVPTIFITVDALRQAMNQHSVDKLAEKIVRRVNAMISWEEIKNCNELQLDCDWTASTRDAYYKLCKEVKKCMDKDWLLSSTIRLHQLQQAPPPVDYGVLMVYNVGNFKNPNEENSILNSRTVEKFLTRRLRCDMPMDVALPIYKWDLLFDNDYNFVRICYKGEVPEKGFRVRHEEVPYAEIMKVKSLLRRHLHLTDGAHSTILYHMDDSNIYGYIDEQFKDIFDN